MQAYGGYAAGKTAKAQAKLDAANFAAQSTLANFNAGQIEQFAKVNKNLVLAVSGLNTQMTSTIADMNVNLLNSTTDFNVGVIRATTDFNVSSAEGAAQMIEARSAMEAANHNFNADLLELQAQDTLEAGAQAQRQSRQAYAQVKGRQRASLAANGVALDEGSALRIQTDTDFASDQDADTIKSNAMKAAMGYRINSLNEQTAAKFASLDGQAQALGKRAEAVAARINGSVGIAQAELDRATGVQGIRTTSSVQILQERTNAQIEAFNIDSQASADAWAARASALGYSGQAAQARTTAKSINPGLTAGTSLVAGAANLASQAYGYYNSGALGSKPKAA